MKDLAMKFGKFVVVAVLAILAYVGGASTSDTIKIVGDKDAAKTYCTDVLDGNVALQTKPAPAK